MDIDLTGKVALITGSSRGIGKGCALEMARAGANITINHLNHENDAGQVAEEIQALSRETLIIQEDVSDLTTVDHMVEVTDERFGHLDIAVCNAYYSKRQPFLDIDIEEIKRSIDVTMWGIKV